MSSETSGVRSRLVEANAAAGYPTDVDLVVKAGGDCAVAVRNRKAAMVALPLVQQLYNPSVQLQGTTIEVPAHLFGAFQILNHLLGYVEIPCFDAVPDEGCFFRVRAREGKPSQFS